jgi:hypothetical protein
LTFTVIVFHARVPHFFTSINITKASTGAPPCTVETFEDWQADGHDAGSTINLDLSNDAILSEARAKLGLPPKH